MFLQFIKMFSLIYLIMSHPEQYVSYVVLNNSYLRRKCFKILTVYFLFHAKYAK